MASGTKPERLSERRRDGASGLVRKAMHASSDACGSEQLGCDLTKLKAVRSDCKPDSRNCKLALVLLL